MGIRFLWAEVRDHADIGCGLVGGYVVSVDGEKCVHSFDIFPTLHEASESSAGRFAPGGAVLAVNASGKEVTDTCFCASGQVHDRVGEMVGKEVCVVWVSLASGGDDEVVCFVRRGVTVGIRGGGASGVGRCIGGMMGICILGGV